MSEYPNATMHEINLTPVGDGRAIELPGSLVASANLGDAERVQAFASPAGVLLCRADPETAKQIEIAQQVMADRREALRRLAE